MLLVEQRDQNNNRDFIMANSDSTIVAGRDYFNNTPMPGYTLYTYPHQVTGAARAAVADFNSDGSPDFVAGRKHASSGDLGISTITFRRRRLQSTLFGDWGLAAAAV